MSTTKITAGITIGILLLTGVIFYAFEKKADKIYGEASPEIKLEQSWELPNELDEISGMVFLDENRLACVQDEDGIIFIYNLETSKIEDRIEFGGTGDYEGIAFNNTTMFVVTGDGKLIKIETFHRDPTVTEYQTSLSQKNDVESLFFDNGKNQLLIALKEQDPNSDEYKGIYTFNLNTSKLEEQPAYKIDLNAQIFEELDEDNLKERFKPSDIAIHPNTGEIFSVDGTKPKLLILDKQGNAKNLYILNRKDFPQPEGVAFSPSGELYVSSEGNPGVIRKISIK